MAEHLNCLPIFVIILLSGWWIKKAVQDFLDKKNFKELTSEVISDTILFSYIFGIAVITAPYMGYGDNPLLDFFK